MRKLKFVAWLSAALLAACGGGNTLTGPGSGGTGNTTVATITVTSSTTSIAADGSDSATITAVAKDASNVLVSGVTMSFATSGGDLAVTQATTDSSGRATATLSAGTLAAGTAITVTASSGSVSGQVVVNVVNTQQTLTLTTSSPQIPSDGSSSATITALVRGASNQFLSGVSVCFSATSGGLGGLTGGCATTDVNGSATATLSPAGDKTNRRITVTATAGTATDTVAVDVTGTRLSVTGPASLIQNAQGTYTVALIDAGNNGIPNTTVTLTSAQGNTLSPSTVTTSSAGQATFNVTGTVGGDDTLTAAALGLQATQKVSVSSQSFAFTAPAAGAKINLGAVQTISVTWTSNGVAQSGKTINFSTTRGTLSAASAVTDGTGTASVTITSAISGPAIITASNANVSAQVAVDFLATTPATIDVQASPSTIQIQGQSTISAVVRDAANNLVEGKTVDFQTVNDVTGGTITVASATTDSQGQAQTTYQASSTPSSSDGVTIQATVSGTSISDTTKLTVGGRTVFLSMGTGNHIGENDNKTSFIVPYFVQALDSSGAALKNTTINLTIHSAAPSPLIAYGKGGWVVSGSAWVQTGTPNIPGSFTPITVCPNEDQNLNGVLDIALGEDVSGQGNNNGKLDPGDVAAVQPGTVTTDDNGQATFNVVYPEDHALWVQVKLTATATVQGTETSTSALFWLPMLATYVTSTTSDPPGKRSPYGIATSCTNPN